MFDQAPTVPLRRLESESLKHFQALMENGVSFSECRKYTTELRLKFPRVEFYGPLFLPREETVALELSLCGEKVEVSVPASETIIQENKKGW